MKVCVITPAFYPAIVYGGPIISTYHTYEELAKLGVEVFVATTNANGKKKLEVEPNRYIPFNDHLFVKYYDDTVIGRFSWRFVFSVWQDIRGCDLVRVEDIFSTYIPPSLLFARLFRKPALISARGALSEWSLRNKRALAKKMWLALLINPFVRKAWWHATSGQEKREILELYPAAKVIVIPNGADVAEFGNARRLPGNEYLRKFAGVDRQPGKIVVSMGRLHKKKGFTLLIEAFGGLLSDFIDAVLLIAGEDDGERGSLENQIERLGLKGKVFLVGELKGQDKAEFLAGADMFVLPSYSENFGNVYLEAMAAGLPIVASKGTPWEQVERIGCGKWVECSADAVRSAMYEILAGDHGAMGKLAREYAQQYDWRNIARGFESAFAMMLGLPRLEMNEHPEIDHAEK
ncbi:MAG: glycosyltransferase [Sulfuricella sp.]|nr:glycosyltransferase [Sulfuricella sp.]